MFYSEYRPQKFSDLIGAEHIVSAITGALAKNQPAHTYFFSGSRGVGKTTTARLLAKALNCESPITPIDGNSTGISFEPCNKCQSCIAVLNGRHLDLIEIDAASNRGIDNIRDLKDNVSLSPTMGKNKVYIIDEVHMLTAEASNALLKLLEEPPTHAYFVLCTTNPEKVLDTIKSRCQQFQFKRPHIGNLVKKLRKIAEDKGHNISDDHLRRVSVVAKGAYREAETLLEQLINGEVSIDLLLDENSSNYFDLMSMLVKGDPAGAINFIHAVYSNGHNIEIWTERFISYVRSILMSKLGVKDNEGLNSAGGDISVEDLSSIIKKFNQAVFEFKSAVIPTLPIEMAIIDICLDRGILLRWGGGKPDSGDDGVPSSPPDPKPKGAKKPSTIKPFPYKDLIEAVKSHNHSIYLILSSCDLVGYDGKYLTLCAYYSFYKERIMSFKVKEIIQSEAEKLAGSPVVLKCKLSDRKPNARELTDKNVKPVKDVQNIEEVFEKVFGDDLEES